MFVKKQKNDSFMKIIINKNIKIFVNNDFNLRKLHYLKIWVIKNA